MSESDSETASSAGSIVEDASEPDVSGLQCLFCSGSHNNVDTMFAHVESDHEFAIRDTIRSIGAGTSNYSPRHRDSRLTRNKSSRR